MSILSVLTRAEAADVISLADALLPSLRPIEVLSNRTGIVMMPAKDSVSGDVFHLGEVLVAEAHIRFRDDGTEGYGAVVGRDTRHALAVAVIDAAMRAGVSVDVIEANAERLRAKLDEEDRQLMRKVATTRVVMETF
jgi:alpha-D-ribose 1-methylphosphonate 5-triphosphate synthase subunit PhnG